MTQETENPLTLLTNYLAAVDAGDPSADDLLDELIAGMETEALAAATGDLIETGPVRSWMGALNLAGLLAGGFPELWQGLVSAIETREDLGTIHLMAGIALLQVEKRLPETGRCRELANDWSEFPDAANSTENAILNQLKLEPESAFLIMEGLGDCPPGERAELFQEMQSKTTDEMRSRLLHWFAFVPDKAIAEAALDQLQLIYTSSKRHPEPPPLFGWVTDLTAAGQFGAGVELYLNPPQRIILGGSWRQGIRLFDRVEGPGDDSAFIPDLPAPRAICTHPTLVKKWAVALIEAGWHEQFQSSDHNVAWSAGIVHEILENWTREDETAWNGWSRVLIELNPVNSKTEALQVDADLISAAVPHWVVPDELARELCTEFQGMREALLETRLKSVARVWFERSLGPNINRLLENLQAMAYFWLALGETDVMNRDELTARARAAARIAADLSDPARIVASHPFIESWSIRTLAAVATSNSKAIAAN